MGSQDESFVTIQKKLNIKREIPEIEAEYRASGIIKNEELIIVSSVMYNDNMWGCILFNEGNIKDLFE